MRLVKCLECDFLKRYDVDEGAIDFCFWEKDTIHSKKHDTFYIEVESCPSSGECRHGMATE